VNPPPRSSQRSLLPREHGAYAELLFPLVTALFLGRPTLAGVLLALGIVAAFLLHEPVLVLLGRRGSQARENHGDRARRRLLILSTFTCVGSVAGLWMAGPEARWAFAALLLPAALLGLLVATKREKNVFGESLVALVLSGAAMPVALSCGVGVRATLGVAAIWTMVFLLGTATVHSIFARSRNGTRRPWFVVSCTDLLLIAACIAFFVGGGPRWILAPIPAAVVSLAILGFNLSPRRLKVLGWALVGSNLVTLMILVTHAVD